MTKGFIARSEHRQSVLMTEVTVHEGFDPLSEPANPGVKCVAIWDTGATHTVITRRIIDKLGLKDEGVAQTFTAAGPHLTEVYFVNIWLPNQMGFPMLRVSRGKLHKGADVLIGMDIIGAGDFAVTCKNGKTAFSYRYPSIEEIDLTNKSSAPRPAAPHIGRNSSCPCGSGKKYKKCCGASN